MSDTKVPTPEQIAELRAVWSRFVAEQTLSARTSVVDEFIGCRRISALLDAAERCAELERKLNHEAYVSDKRASERDLAERGRDALRTHLDAAIARAEAAEEERDRMRPVVVGAATLEHLETLRRAVKDYVNTAVAEPAAKGASSS